MTLLNLGCGRMIFPTTPDDPMVAHVKYVLSPHVPESFNSTAQWVNVDMTPWPGVNEIIDLFAFPWIRSSNGSPFNNSSIDTIWCSHIVEHIPHDARLTPAAGLFPTVTRAAKNDGWWGFFAECWRVLKPGGVIHILSPMGFSTAGICDPTHRRFLSPGSFSYFSPNPQAPFDYLDAAHFEATGNATVRLLGDAAKLSEMIISGDIWMKQARPGDPERLKVSDTLEQMRQSLNEWMDHQLNVADEFYIAMRAVKEPG